VQIGAHVSVAGGLVKAFPRGLEWNCESLQIFTKSQVQWAAKPLDPDDVYAWLSAWEEQEWQPCIVHGCYLVNLCSPSAELRQKSVAAVIDEIERAATLGIPWVIVHPGSFKDTTLEPALDFCTASVREILEQTEGCGAGLLLENTAGMGSSVGCRFEDLGQVIRQVNRPEQLGVCFDTCHAFAAGYDLRTPAAYADTWARFDRIIGLDHLKAFHLNDCKSPLASRIDRHEGIGQGAIGVEGFRLLMNDPRFEFHPGVVELKDELVLGSLELLDSLRQQQG
jgi:deoxyribonuclease-4